MGSILLEVKLSMILDNNSLNCSDMDRVPSNAEKIDEKTVRMKVKKD